MEYHKVINLLDNTPNQTNKLRTEYWIDINGDARGKHDKDSKIRFQTSSLKLSLIEYSDAYILVKGTISITQILTEAEPDDNGKVVVLKSCGWLTEWISEKNHTEIDNARDIYVVMLMYNLIECSDKYSKASGSF